MARRKTAAVELPHEHEHTVNGKTLTPGREFTVREGGVRRRYRYLYTYTPDGSLTAISVKGEGGIRSFRPGSVLTVHSTKTPRKDGQ